jgi:general secretion pathway protein E
MGIEPFLLTSTVRAVIGQRLVRTLCPVCRRAHPATAEEQRALRACGLSDRVDALMLYHPVGCDQCAGNGYWGRLGLFEVLILDEELRRLTQERVGADALDQAACAQGMVSMVEDGLRKVLDGSTTLEEVRRVTDLR